MEIKSINPYNQEVLEVFEGYSDSRISQMLKQSQNAFSQWKNTSYSKRSELLRKVAFVLKENQEAWARDITLEMGKPLPEAKSEVEKCAWVCEFYAEHAEEFLSNEIVESDASKSWIQYQPLGPVLAIMPWNYPLWQVFRFAAPAVMAGNTGILKHASNVSRSALNIEQIFEKAGAPNGVFQTILAEIAQVEDAIKGDVIRAVTLTGSERAGSSVASLAGKNIKKTVLELGGSNAFVVLEDADLQKILPLAVTGRFQNTGQSCIAAKRFILHQDIAEEFMEHFKRQVGELKAGDPLVKDTDIGPMAREDLAEELEDQVQKSLAKGAKVALGGNREGAFFEPTILTDVSPGMPAFDEELFGPVAAVTVVNSQEEALEMVNNSDFGLGASVCTEDMVKAQKFIDEVEDGAVFVNSFVKSDPRLPFGGTKTSGYGRELSYHGIREFVNIKTVYIK